MWTSSRTANDDGPSTAAVSGDAGNNNDTTKPRLWSRKTTSSNNSGGEEGTTSSKLSIWDSVAAATKTKEEPTTAATKSRGGIRVFGLGGKGGKKEANEEAQPEHSYSYEWAQEMRNETDEPEGRSDANEENGGDYRKKKRWNLLQKALSKEVPDEDLAEIEQEEIKSISSGSFSTFLHNPNQTRVVFRQFGSDPKEVIRIEQSDDIPAPMARDHVLVRVQVRVE